jgi:hypothetical protein
MPPSTPISSLILANVKTTIETLAAGSTYFYTPGDVRHFEDYALDLTTGATFPVYFIAPQAEPTASRQMAGTHQLVTFGWEVTLVGVHHGGASRSESWGTQAVEQMRHDLLKALRADPTRGGYAIDTKVQSINRWVADFQAYDASVAVTFEITYRHRENDPSAQ